MKELKHMDLKKIGGHEQECQKICQQGSLVDQIVRCFTILGKSINFTKTRYIKIRSVMSTVTVDGIWRLVTQCSCSIRNSLMVRLKNYLKKMSILVEDWKDY